MNMLTFIRTYFNDWSIASISTYGTIHGYLKLRHNETFVKVYFNLNGSKHWTDYCVTVDHVTSAE